MPSPAVSNVTLIPHPETSRSAVRTVGARVARSGETLSVTYTIEGDVDGIRLPPPRPPRTAARLWQHTCFELFIARQGDAGYYEFNLAPSGEWAVYGFERYRRHLMLEDAAVVDPQIAIRREARSLALDALIALDRLAPTYARAALFVALAAVVEDDDGSLSYWALKHPPGAPDFHHPDSFQLRLDEIRH